MSENRVHLVLGAGGVRCISFVGALDALERAGIEVQSLSCASAGTLFGALYAAGVSVRELEDLVRSTNLAAYQGKKYLFPRFFRWPFSTYRNALFPELLRERLGADLTFGDLRIPLATIAIDLTSRRLLVYASETHPEMAVAEALHIATAAPGMYPPMRRDGRILIDGGIASEAPVWLATRRHESLPILVLTTGGVGDTRAPRNLGEFLGRAISAAVTSRDELLIERTPRARRVGIDCADITHNQFDLSLEQKVYLLEAGRLAVQRVLREDDALEPAHRTQSRAVADDTNVDDKAAAYGQQVEYHFYAEAIHMGDVIKAGKQSIINVKSTVGDVTQIIGDSNHLSPEEQSAATQSLEALKAILEQQRATHADEVALIEGRLGELMAQVDRPAAERKKSLLEISASGLKEAAKALASATPDILAVVAKLAAFAVALVP